MYAIVSGRACAKGRSARTSCMPFQSGTKPHIRKDLGVSTKDNAPQPSPLYFFFPNVGPISWHNGFCSGVLRAASSGLCRELASIKQL